MLAITVEVTVKLLPVPPVATLVMATFDSVEDAGNAVGKVIGAGIIPAGLELMDSPAIVAAEAFAQCGYPTDVAALLLCELDGTAEEVAAQVAAVSAVFETCSVVNLHIAESEDERLQLWKGRKSAFRRGPTGAGLLLYRWHDSASSIALCNAPDGAVVG